MCFVNFVAGHINRIVSKETIFMCVKPSAFYSKKYSGLGTERIFKNNNIIITTCH